MQLRADKERKSGILLAISSLPSVDGIGTFGQEAFKFVDFLKRTNQTYWQILPLCPIGKGNSPYSSKSTFAIEILYIDISLLVTDGLLDESDIKYPKFSQFVDYDAVRAFKIPLLKKAAANFKKDNPAFLKFKTENEFWLKEFCLFSAIAEIFKNAEFANWPDPLKYRKPDSLIEFESQYTELIDFFEITQFLAYTQYTSLKNYANSSGIKIIGDIPFYVSLNSADVWSNPQCFKLGRDMTPVLISGVPPDMFSSEGQLWENPIYDWEFQKQNRYSWWRKRLQKNAELYDVIRIDHFRGFADYYTIAYGAKNAKFGNWQKGPGIDFWSTMKDLLNCCEIIAEDLGVESAALDELLRATGFPNMKILQFAFDSDLKDPFLPKNFSRNCVCYTGTHDNDTTLGWYEKGTEKERDLYERLVPTYKRNSPALNLINFGMKSKAKIVIIPLCDYLELPSNCRMNLPGKAYGNWRWRFKKGDLCTDLENLIINLTKGRNKQ